LKSAGEAATAAWWHMCIESPLHSLAPEDLSRKTTYTEEKIHQPLNRRWRINEKRKEETIHTIDTGLITKVVGITDQTLVNSSIEYIGVARIFALDALIGVVPC